MIFNPETRELFTDSGQYLKTLGCVAKADWREMMPRGAGSRLCALCSRSVHDTSAMTDEEVRALLQREPGACLAVSPLQRNITLRLSPLTRISHVP